MKLAADLYAYVWKGNDNNCNTYIFANTVKGNKHILIDPGHIITPFLREAAFEILTSQIAVDGLKLEDVGLIALTHAHPDHIEAVAKVKEKSQAPVALHKYDEEVFRRFNNIKIDFYLSEGDLKLDSLVQEKLEIYHTPGHSPGQIAIYWPSKKALAVGDDVFYHNTGRFDLPGGDLHELKQSIDRLSQLDVEFLLCGHPYESPGVIRGKAAVKENFEFIKTHLWF
jgi:hydroxyacylglutathione hydrolase